MLSIDSAFSNKGYFDMMKSSFSLVIGHGKFMSVWRKSVTGIRFSVISLRAIFRRSLNLVSNSLMRSAVVVPMIML